MVKFDVKKFVLAILFSLILITILNQFLTEYYNVPVLKTGYAFILIFIGIYVTMIFVVAHDYKFDRGEWIMLALVAVFLIGAHLVLKTYFPDIYSAVPTRELFSTVGV